MAHHATEAPTDIDRAAIERCLAGDGDAFRVIVERYADVLYGTALLMLRDRAAADDAVQEAFVSAWRGLGTFDTARSLRPWLIRILVNHILQRRRRRFLPLVRGERVPALASTEPGPESIAEQAWERRALARALSAIPEDAARIVVLRFFAELTQDEIADVLDLRVGTVKSRLHRALQRLRRELERNPEFGGSTNRETGP